MNKDVPAVVRAAKLGTRYAAIGCWIRNRLLIWVDEALSGKQRDAVVAEVKRLATLSKALCLPQSEVNRMAL